MPPPLPWLRATYGVRLRKCLRLVQRLSATRNRLAMRLRLYSHPSDPLVLDRNIDVAFAVLWAIYAAWGLFSTIYGVATITDGVGPLYNFLWSGGIGTMATIACLAACSLFFDLGTKLRPPVKKRIELWAVRVLTCLIIVYPVLLTIGALAGDANRGPSAVLAFSYLVMPILRSIMLKKRIVSFERSIREILSNGSK